MSQFFTAVVATPGTPQRLAGTTVPAQAAVSGGLAGIIAPRGSTIVITARVGNTAAKNVFWGSSAMNVGAKTGLGGHVLTGGVPVVIPVNDTEVDLGDWWIDTDSVAAATEGIEVSVL